MVNRSDSGTAGVWVVLGLALVATAALVLVATRATPHRLIAGIPIELTKQERVRHALFRELQPVPLANCELERFGEEGDGGYLMCGNLLGAAQSAYSYGISGYDGWGCEISQRISGVTHQYDCFDLTVPPCPSGQTVFHPLCVAGRPTTDDEGRVFETLEQHIADNGDRLKRIVVKMDVEGAEWESLLEAPADVLRRIEQLAIEFHGVDQERYLAAVRKLKRFFVVAHVHMNNYTCNPALRPFPAWAYEVLLVNKRLARPGDGPVVLPHPLDAPNSPDAPECPPRFPRVPQG